MNADLLQLPDCHRESVSEAVKVLAAVNKLVKDGEEDYNIAQ
jgi:hypothetical protein